MKNTEGERWRQLALQLFRYCKGINIAAQTILMSIPDFPYTQPEDQSTEELVLPQTVLSHIQPYNGEIMDIDSRIDWNNQIHMHETEKSMVVSKKDEIQNAFHVPLRTVRKEFNETFNQSVLPSLKVKNTFLKVSDEGHQAPKIKNLDKAELAKSVLKHPMKSLDSLSLRNIARELKVIPVEFFDWLKLKSLSKDEHIDVLEMFLSSFVTGRIVNNEMSKKFAVQLPTPLGILMYNIIQVGSKLENNIQCWAVGQHPPGLKVLMPMMHMKSSDMIPISKKLQHEKSMELSLSLAPVMCEMFRMDYHCLKVNFERQYDLVLNLHVFQFLEKLEPQILSNFNPPCILNLIRAVACLINQGIWREVYALSLKQREKEEK